MSSNKKKMIQNEIDWQDVKVGDSHYQVAVDDHCLMVRVKGSLNRVWLSQDMLRWLGTKSISKIQQYYSRSEPEFIGKMPTRVDLPVLSQERKEFTITITSNKSEIPVSVTKGISEFKIEEGRTEWANGTEHVSDQIKGVLTYLSWR